MGSASAADKSAAPASGAHTGAAALPPAARRKTSVFAVSTSLDMTDERQGNEAERVATEQVPSAYSAVALLCVRCIDAISNHVISSWSGI